MGSEDKWWAVSSQMTGGEDKWWVVGQGQTMGSEDHITTMTNQKKNPRDVVNISWAVGKFYIYFLFFKFF